MSSAYRRRTIRRNQEGRYELRLRPSEREILAQLPEALSTVLKSAGEGPAAAPELVRLFPPAYYDDAAAERSYREIVRDDLIAHHNAALEVLAATVDAKELDEEQVAAWLDVLNDVRLVLGTTLGVTEEGPPELDDDVDVDRYALYGYLSFLVEQIVEAVSSALPAPVPGADDLAPGDPWGEPPEGLRWSTPGAPREP